ncbi:MAG TPA: hypothetical protein VM580_25545, partial [Labilithrix sp.]|nr:hypothetical protein [Labilithrix sp.]
MRAVVVGGGGASEVVGGGGMLDELALAAPAAPFNGAAAAATTACFVVPDCAVRMDVGIDGGAVVADAATSAGASSVVAEEVGAGVGGASTAVAGVEVEVVAIIWLGRSVGPRVMR